jgi:uncharacterized protein YjbI with pentapeptide repeats
MARIGYPPFANLTSVDVSQKKPNWSRKKDDSPDFVTGAQLRGANLRYALAQGAFFARADLHSAYLSGADLDSADLSGADLSHADLTLARLPDAHLDRAYLFDANLTFAVLSHAGLQDADLGGADLHGADLGRAYLAGAILTDSDLRGAKDLDARAVKSALHWDKAFYDCEIIEALHLPPDNNVKLFEELHNDNEHPQKQAAKPPEPCPAPKQ